MKYLRFNTYLALAILVLLVNCNSVFYYPNQTLYRTPKHFNLDYKSYKLNSTDNIKLDVWFTKSSCKSPKGSVLQFHGNAENQSSHFMSLVWVIKYCYNLISFDYRGYGQSTGKPNAKGISQDGERLIRFLTDLPEKQRGRKLILYGQSLGGAIALKSLVNSNLKQKISGLVIESSFLSYQEIGRSKLNNLWLTWPFQHLAYLLLSDKYSAKNELDKLSGLPLIVLHGDSDQVVPIEFGLAIYNEYHQPKKMITIAHGRHLRLFTSEKSQKLKLRLINEFNLFEDVN